MVAPDAISSMIATVLKTFSPRAYARRIPLDEIPAEIIHHILLLAPQASILNFGLTNRRNYELCLPALHYTVTLTYDNYAQFASKIYRHDASLRWVRELHLSYPSRVTIIDALRWNVLSDALILTAFPNLQSLDVLRHASMVGWTGLIHVLETLPDTMVSLKGRVQWTGDVDYWPVDRVFLSYKTLHLAFDLYHLAQEFSSICDVPSVMSNNFPCLTDLSIVSPCMFDNLGNFFVENHFSALECFTLAIADPNWTSHRLDLEESRALATFLSRYATTLRELSLPSCDVEEEAAPFFSSIAFGLHHLCACPHLALTLGQSPALSSNLETLRISSCPHPMASIQSPPRVMTAVHTLEVESAIGFPLILDDLPRLVPGLKTIRFHLGAVFPVKDALPRLQQCQALFRECQQLEQVVFYPSNASLQTETFRPVRDAGSRIVKLQRV